MSTTVVTTVTLSHEAAQAASLVGRNVKVDYLGGTWTVHSVEGPTYYAFQQDGRVTVDDGMTLADWITEPIAMIIPVDSKIGEGFGQTIGVSELSLVGQV